MYLKRNVVWLLTWIGISSAGRNRLAKIELIISQKQLHQLTSLIFIPLQQTHKRMPPNTDCLAVLDGVCTKRNMAWFGLLLVENEVNNNSQTRPLIYLTSLAIFYSKTLLLK